MKVATCGVQVSAEGAGVRQAQRLGAWWVSLALAPVSALAWWHRWCPWGFGSSFPSWQPRPCFTGVSFDAHFLCGTSNSSQPSTR